MRVTYTSPVNAWAGALAVGWTGDSSMGAPSVGLRAGRAWMGAAGGRRGPGRSPEGRDRVAWPLPRGALRRSGGTVVQRRRVVGPAARGFVLEGGGPAGEQTQAVLGAGAGVGGVGRHGEAGL